MKKKLTKEQHQILIEKGTEEPFTGKLLHHKQKGIYHCGSCGTELFSSKTKFDSKSGWPSFSDAKNVELKENNSLGMHRVEVFL